MWTPTTGVARGWRSNTWSAGGAASIATIAGRQDMAAGADRLAGYREALDAAGLPADHRLRRLHPRLRACTRCGACSTSAPALDAVFVASDIMAAGALHALRRAGRRVPDDVAVIGFDDLPLAQHTQPPLTTVRQPLERVGAVAAHRLLAALDGDCDAADPVLPTTLVTRESA